MTSGWPTSSHDSTPSEASTPSAVMAKPMPTAVIDREETEQEQPVDGAELSTTETSTTTETVTNTDSEETAAEEPADEAELASTPRDDG